MNSRNSLLLVFAFLCICAGCASVGSLEGGKKDTTPPKLLSITPGDSLLNTKVSRIDLRFDEYIALNDPAKEIQISPLLSIPPSVTSLNKRVTVKIPDTLLQENTTYRISFGSSVKDIHEENKITGFTYTFSTGSYFDSLEINGRVVNALSGMADSAVTILLYNASVDDSAVIRSRPLYVGRSGGDGSFSVKGLPGRRFRIYALRDGNDNLIFDGGKELIAFHGETIMPGDTAMKQIELRTFEERVDSSMLDTATAGSSIKEKGGSLGKTRKERNEAAAAIADFSYSVGVDTADILKRTKGITKPLEVIFTKEIDSLFASRVTLSIDSINTQPSYVRVDSLRKNVLLVSTDWKPDMPYTFRLLKGFAKDTAGTEALPSKYIFRTKRDDDYSKLTINVPTKYTGSKYILLVRKDNDTLYNKQVIDSAVTIVRLDPGNYSARIIIDENENGVWDTGDLLRKKQPEFVVPYTNAITLKPGWDNIVDFEQDKPLKDRKGASPGKRDKETRK